MGKYNIETIFNECLEKLLTGTETVEQCLQRYPNYAQELEPLLRTAMSVNKAVDIAPSPELKARVRYDLQLKMAAVGKPRRASWLSLQPRWATTMIAVMFVFVLGGGAVLAADSSMPGSLLYPIKILTENISLKLAGSDIEKAELSLTFADRRVEEMNYLIENDKLNDTNMESISNRYIGYLNQVNILSSGAQIASEKGMSLMQAPTAAPVTEDSATGATEEEKTIPQSPPPEITLTIPAEEPPELSAENRTFAEPDELSQMITYYVYHHPQQLEKWLENPNIPEEYKLLIRRMIQDLKNLGRNQ